MKVLVSACLLGNACRYDGRSKECKEIMGLASKVEFVPVCPEQLGGLFTPRLPSEIKGNKVVNSEGKDVTKEYTRGAKLALDIAKENNCKIAILKENSPSCGNKEIYDGSFSGRKVIGAGVTVRLLQKAGIRVYNEKELDLFVKEQL